ncbi:MAG: hypothetical protein PUA61_01400 [Succinatimonas hippei]|nr:hypothetical protein [Succinatimonas hippei]
MKYFILAVLAVFLAYPARAELMTEAEAAVKGQAMMDDFYRNPHTEADRERARQEMIERSQIPHVYTGSGDVLDDRDMYIDGKLYHCIVYKSNTQCHTH